MFEINIKAEIHIHQHGDVHHNEDKVLKKLDNLRSLFMAVRNDIAVFAAKVDAETTLIGNRIQALIDASTTLTPEEKAVLQGISDRLDVIAHDPLDPVPA